MGDTNKLSMVQLAGMDQEMRSHQFNTISAQQHDGQTYKKKESKLEKAGKWIERVADGVDLMMDIT